MNPISLTPDALRDPLVQLHHATQLVASAGQALAEARPDDSHRAMTWDHTLDGFVGAPLASGSRTDGRELRVAVAVRDFSVVLVSGESRTDYSLEGRTLEEANAWMWAALEEHTGHPVTPVHPEFEIPTHPVGEGAAFRVHDAHLRAMASLYGSAATRLDALREARGGSAVLCWPHHFDLATLITAREAVGDDPAHTVGVGLAPMGGGYEEWYWYVSPWPSPDAADLPTLDGGGHWHTEEWVGAVLEGREVVAAGSASEGRALVDKWLDRAVESAHRLVR